MRSIALVTVLLFVAAGCSPAAPAASPPASPAVAKTSPAPPTAAPSAAAVQKSGASASAADWEARWNALIAAARAEGKVIVSGPPTPATRQILPAKFKERFGLELEYFSPGSTSDLLTRLEAERQSGLYTVDVLIGGAQSLYTKVYTGKMADPIKPVLILPEVLDGSKWVNGEVWFMDPEQQTILRLANYVTNQIVVNTEYVKPDEIKNWKDLLDPRFQGKISSYEPTRAGSGWNTANYLQTELGDEFIRRLYVDQKPGISRDYRQLSDWMARGTYPVSLGLREAEIEALRADGFPVTVVPSLSDVRPAVTAGFGLGVLMNQAPNPNAARLFINWIASKEGQEAFLEGEKTVSVRTDVDNSWAAPYAIPAKGVEFFDTYGWDYTLESRSPRKLEKLKQLIGAS